MPRSVFSIPRATDGNNKPVSGAFLYTYEAGTTTPVNTFSNLGNTVANEYPVVADGNGVFPAVYLPGGTYKFRMTDPDGAILYEADNVSVVNGGEIVTVITSDLNLLVPTQYQNTKAAVDAAAGYQRGNGAVINVVWEDGYQPDVTSDLSQYDLTGINFVSRASYHRLSPDFPEGGAIAIFRHCTGVNWSILVDMAGRGCSGLVNYYSDLYVAQGCGVRNVGAEDPTFDLTEGANPRGCGCYTYGGTTDTGHSPTSLVRAVPEVVANAPNLDWGSWYEINEPGTADWTRLGASNSNAGTTFRASRTVAQAGSFKVGKEYEIADRGTVVGGSDLRTDFTLIGAANNSNGTVFTATGVGAGNGLAYETTSGTGTAYEAWPGAVFDTAAWRGMDFTNAASGKFNYVTVKNCGTDPAISEGHAAIFVSRGSNSIHGNHINANGSVRGLRVGRAKVSARDGAFRGTMGHGAWGFELSGITSSSADYSGSGWHGAWSVYGSGYSDRLSIGGVESAATGVVLNGDGSKLFVIGANGDDVTQWTMPEAYDFEALSLDGTFSVASRETAPTGMAFRNDGQRLFIVGTQSQQVHQWNMATGFDVTDTMTYIGGFSVAAQTTSPQDLTFNADGTKMYVLGGDSVHEYALGTAWTVSSATYTDSFSLAAQGTDIRGFDFNPAGTRLYAAARSNDRLLEYELGTAFDASTAVYRRYDWLKSAGANNLYSAGTITGFHFASETRFFFTGESSGVDHIWKYVTQDYPVLYGGGPSNDQPQGPANISAERSSFIGCGWTIAEVDCAASQINIDDVPLVGAFGNMGPVATITSGLVSAARAKFRASADSVAPHGVLSSDAGEFESVGFLFDGNGVVPYAARVAQNGKAHLRGANLFGCATNLFDFGLGDGAIYLQDVTLNGTEGLFAKGADMRPGAEFATRADLVLAGSFGFTMEDGKTCRADGIEYKALNGSTVIGDLTNFIPGGDSPPQAFGASPSASNNTAALNAWIAFCDAENYQPDWGDGEVYAVTDNITSLLDQRHKGRARITRGGQTFYVGAGWQGNQNVIHVSATGAAANDGITSDRAIRHQDVQGYLERQLRIAPHAKWKVSYAAATYSESDTIQFEDFPTTDYPIEFEGQTTGAKSSTTIFDSWTKPVFQKGNADAGNNSLRLHFTNFMAQDCDGFVVDIRHSGETVLDNFNCDGNTSAGPFLLRDCVATIKNAAITDC
ncbi:YncE family protein, partial [Oceaniglobus trochenteri]|uniref:YncE family protein n=1 Tax=Oceaniglobus trochenteri TaxID=2763260 RepID=UPI001CFF7978